MNKNAIGAAAVTLLCVTGGAQAASVTLAGVTFFEESAGVEITGGSGVGTQGNPFVINEILTALDATIGIRNMRAISTVGSFTSGFWISKTVTNNTGITWNAFDLELQELLGTPSPDGDGLSFGQSFAGARPFTSDVFTSASEISDVRDQITFQSGTVLQGESVTFNFVITDNSPVDVVYLRQRPNFVESGVIPLPGALPLLISALGGLALVRRRRRA